MSKQCDFNIITFYRRGRGGILNVITTVLAPPGVRYVSAMTGSIKFTATLRLSLPQFVVYCSGRRSPVVTQRLAALKGI